MTTIPRPAATITAIATAAVVLLALGACSTTPSPVDASDARAAAQSKAARSPADNGTITGSRIPAKSTDRLVRATGNTGAKEMERERPPNPGGLNQ